jgi:hypothetical protein
MTLLYKIWNEVEKERYRQWARDNFNPATGEEGINTSWHPETVMECQRLVQLYKNEQLAPLTKAMIDKVFEEAQDTAYVVRLHSLVVSNWEAVGHLDVYVNVGRMTGEYIMGKAIEFDKAHGATGGAGLTWMNWGFSTHDEVPDWMADFSKADPVYETAVQGITFKAVRDD